MERSRNRPARPPFTFRKEAFQSSVEEQEALKKLKETELEQKLQAKLADEERKAVETMGRFNDIGRMVLGVRSFSGAPQSMRFTSEVNIFY